ncbi:MAG: hypothetical protein J7513_08035 [Solirubrobacteraceae bacterium]|nr:hypothetical protein [Solirubrobacteraceae bacterium]
MRLSRLALPVFAVACTFTSSAHAVENGPAPTVSSVRADAGSYSVSKTSYADNVTPGFGAATVYAPSNTTGQKFGVVSFAPGWTENQSAVDWIARRTASFGFVTIVFDVNNTFFDFPAARAPQLIAALNFVTGTSNQRNLADASREAVVGHSMGGGATLDAARANPSLKATVGLAPWNPGISYSDVTVPSLEIGAQNDFIAGVSNNARYFYNSLPGSTPKAYTEMKSFGHLQTNYPSAQVGAATVSWLKRYVDGDTRYAPFICGAHTGVQNSELSAYASNC